MVDTTAEIMSSFKPGQIFASISTQPHLEPAKMEEKKPKNVKLSKESSNEIKVCATAEQSESPDRCNVTVSVVSAKDQAADAKNSVQRRVDYVLQTLHSHQVKENDIHVHKVLQRIDGLYHFDSEITIQFHDFNKCQSICNFLVEKLDETVKVSLPTFSQSSHRLETLRRQTSIVAVKNAREKAGEIAQLLQAKLGAVVAVREEQVSEWEGPADGTPDSESTSAIYQRISQATIHVMVKVSATFELCSKSRKNRENKS